MADTLLKEIISASEALPALELRVYVIAWGITFDGTVSHAENYIEALLETISDNLKFVSETPSSQTEKVEKSLAEAANLDGKDAEEKYLHLRAARTENGGTLPWLRIPFADISGFALQPHQAAQRSKAGF